MIRFTFLKDYPNLVVDAANDYEWVLKHWVKCREIATVAWCQRVT